MLRCKPSPSSVYVAAASRIELHAGRYAGVHAPSSSRPVANRSSISLGPYVCTPAPSVTSSGPREGNQRHLGLRLVLDQPFEDGLQDAFEVPAPLPTVT